MHGCYRNLYKNMPYIEVADNILGFIYGFVLVGCSLVYGWRIFGLVVLRTKKLGAVFIGGMLFFMLLGHPSSFIKTGLSIAGRHHLVYIFPSTPITTQVMSSLYFNKKSKQTTVSS